MPVGPVMSRLCRSASQAQLPSVRTCWRLSRRGWVKSTASSDAGYRSLAVCSRRCSLRCSRAVHSMSTSRPRRSSKLSAAASSLWSYCWTASARALSFMALSFSSVCSMSIGPPRGGRRIVGSAADVGVHRRRGRLGRRLQGQTVLGRSEDVLDGAIAIRLKGHGAGARGLKPDVAVLPAQAHDPQTGAIALLGVRPAAEQLGHQLSGGPCRRVRRSWWCNGPRPARG